MLVATAKSDDDAPAPTKNAVCLDRLGKAAVALALLSAVLLVLGQPPSAFRADRFELAGTTATAPPHLFRAGFLAMRKVVVFSLFGDRVMDRDGALANAAAVPLYYPSWTPLFVVDDSIPEAFRAQLTAAGGAVVVLNGTGDGWGEAKRIQRYLALADPAVQYAMFRDADSRISAREIAAVNAWLQTNRTFHVMRDHPHHGVVMLGGMWGVDAAAIRRRLGDVRQNIVDYVERRAPNANRGTDQDWLTDVIWPLIGDDVVDHDAFQCGEISPYSRPFPLPRDYHGEFVGLVQDTSEDEGARNPEHVAFWTAYREHGRDTFKYEVPETCRLQPKYIYG